MKYWFPAILLAITWVLVIIILLTPETSNGHGLPHADYKVMDQGGDGAARHASLLLAGWLLGSVLIAIFVSLLAWGTVGPPDARKTAEPSNPQKPDRRWLVFLIGGLLYEAAFGMMCLAYRDSLTSADVAFVGPFPAGVTWLLFGIWFVPTFFVVVYVVSYDRWIYPPANARRFARLVSQAIAPDEGPQNGGTTDSPA